MDAKTLDALDMAVSVLGTEGFDGEAVVLQSLRDRLDAAEAGWYCAHCQRGVDPSEVTFNEAHAACGRIISNDTAPPAPAAQQGLDVGELWSFLRGAMIRGADIQASAQMTEEFHARIDAAASERADALIELLAAAPRNDQGGE